MYLVGFIVRSSQDLETPHLGSRSCDITRSKQECTTTDSSAHAIQYVLTLTPSITSVNTNLSVLSQSTNVLA